MSLERALSKLGVASRGEARRLIAEDRVRVNGQPARDPLTAVNPDRARIEVDGQAVRKQAAAIFAMHKPVGIVTTRADELGRRTVFDLLPPGLPYLAAVGRLDFESSGLLLFTNDSRLADAITAPGSCAKTYRVRLDRPLDEPTIAEYRRGMTLPGEERLAPVGVTIDADDPTLVELVLHEGRNRQIRRMCGERGYAVRELHRIAIGPIALGSQAEGTIRPLDSREEAALRAAVTRARAATSSRPRS